MIKSKKIVYLYQKYWQNKLEISYRYWLSFSSFWINKSLISFISTFVFAVAFPNIKGLQVYRYEFLCLKSTDFYCIFQTAFISLYALPFVFDSWDEKQTLHQFITRQVYHYLTCYETEKINCDVLTVFFQSCLAIAKAVTGK